MDVDDLVGAREIADRLGVRQASMVHHWRRRHADFPVPVVTLHAGHFWLWPEVERWARATGRLKL